MAALTMKRVEKGIILVMHDFFSKHGIVSKKGERRETNHRLNKEVRY